MRVIQYRQYGDPSSVVEVVEIPVIEPANDEVIISLEAAPVHLADIKNIKGEPWFRAPLPAIAGYEGVGRVKRLGSDVTNFKIGDRVFFPTGFGAWREEFRASSKDLWRAPDGIVAEQLALLPINLQTAYLMLKEGVSFNPGDWIIQNAANSNVGYYVIQLARMMGLRTINVVRRDELRESLLEAGADHVFVDGNDLATRVGELGLNIRLAIDAVGGAATSRLANCLGYDGAVVNYGFLSGEECHIAPEQMMFKQLTLKGFYTRASLARMSAKDIEAMRRTLTDFITRNPPNAPIAGVYKFENIHVALEHAARTEEGRIGKVILVP